MGLKWKFQRGGGDLNQKTFHGRGMDIFRNNTFLMEHAACLFEFFGYFVVSEISIPPFYGNFVV